jgi:uncharacterized Zn-finger protein
MMTTKHDDVLSDILRAIVTVALHILALPFVLLAATANVRKLAMVAARLKAGSITCPYCSAENTLNMMSRCSCGAVEPGSRLRCSFCGAVYDVIPCAGCGATLRIL